MQTIITADYILKCHQLVCVIMCSYMASICDACMCVKNKTNYCFVITYQRLVRVYSIAFE